MLKTNAQTDYKISAKFQKKYDHLMYLLEKKLVMENYYVSTTNSSDVWAGRHLHFFSIILQIFFYEKIYNPNIICINRLNDLFVLENLIEIEQSKKYPENIILLLRKYLKTLPGYQVKPKEISYNIHGYYGYFNKIEKVYEMHGFIAMYPKGFVQDQELVISCLVDNKVYLKKLKLLFQILKSYKKKKNH